MVTCYSFRGMREGVYNVSLVGHPTVVVFLALVGYIIAKKLNFALTFLRMDIDNIVRRMFIAKFLAIMNHTGTRSLICFSPTEGIIVSAEKVGLLNILQGMVSSIFPVMSKKKWSEIIWRKAWEYEDMY